MGRAVKHKRGYLIIDAAFGLALIGALIALLAAGATQYQRSTKRMAQQRQALRLAEEALTRLQFDEAPGPDTSLSINPDPPATLPDRRWVTVTAHVGDATANLTGLAPVDHLQSLPEAAP